MNLLVVGGQFQVARGLKGVVEYNNALPQSDLLINLQWVDWPAGLESGQEPGREPMDEPSLTTETIAAWMREISTKQAHYILLSIADVALNAKQQGLYETLLEELVRYAKEQEKTIIAISDNQVFDGIKHSPYVESDTVSPFSDYGRRVIALENLLNDAALERYIVLRCGWVYSPWGDNHLTRLLSQVRNGESLVHNPAHIASPTSAYDIARVMIAMLKQMDCGAQCWGVYHYTSTESLNAYQFSEAAMALCGQYDRELAEASIDMVEKPGYNDDRLGVVPVALACKRLLNNFGIKQAAWHDGLVEVVEKIYAEPDAEQSKQAS